MTILSQKEIKPLSTTRKRMPLFHMSLLALFLKIITFRSWVFIHFPLGRVYKCMDLCLLCSMEKSTCELILSIPLWSVLFHLSKWVDDKSGVDIWVCLFQCYSLSVLLRKACLVNYLTTSPLMDIKDVDNSVTTNSMEIEHLRLCIFGYKSKSLFSINSWKDWSFLFW